MVAVSAYLHYYIFCNYSNVTININSEQVNKLFSLIKFSSSPKNTLNILNVTCLNHHGGLVMI